MTNWNHGGQEEKIEVVHVGFIDPNTKMNVGGKSRGKYIVINGCSLTTAERIFSFLLKIFQRLHFHYCI